MFLAVVRPDLVVIEQVDRNMGQIKVWKGVMHLMSDWKEVRVPLALPLCPATSVHLHVVNWPCVPIVLFLQ